MPQKVCGGDILHVMTFARNFWNAPKSNSFSFSLFSVRKLITCLFLKCPIFNMLENFEMPNFRINIGWTNWMTIHNLLAICHQPQCLLLPSTIRCQHLDLLRMSYFRMFPICILTRWSWTWMSCFQSFLQKWSPKYLTRSLSLLSYWPKTFLFKTVHFHRPSSFINGSPLPAVCAVISKPFITVDIDHSLWSIDPLGMTVDFDLDLLKIEFSPSILSQKILNQPISHSWRIFNLNSRISTRIELIIELRSFDAFRVKTEPIPEL